MLNLHGSTDRMAAHTSKSTANPPVSNSVMTSHAPASMKLSASDKEKQKTILKQYSHTGRDFNNKSALGIVGGSQSDASRIQITRSPERHANNMSQLSGYTNQPIAATLHQDQMYYNQGNAKSNTQPKVNPYTQSQQSNYSQQAQQSGANTGKKLSSKASDSKNIHDKAM